jgi:hypothetical protein
MRNYWLILAIAALASLVGLQTTRGIEPVPLRQAAYFGAPLQTSVSGPALFVGHHAATGSVCCPREHKVCVPEPSKKKTTNYVYDCKQEDLCLPKCPRVILGRSHCGQPACQDCERHRTKTVLIKKVKIEECDSFKCVAKPGVPCAPLPRRTPHGSCSEVIMTLPPPK